MSEKELQQLIDLAPDYGVPTEVMARVIVPVLQEYAASLPKKEYYIPVGKDDNWVITVLESQLEPYREKRVLYANDNSNTGMKNKLKLLPTTHLLFEMFGRSELDSVIFLDSLSLVRQEVERLDLSQEINTRLKQFYPPSAYC